MAHARLTEQVAVRSVQRAEAGSTLQRDLDFKELRTEEYGRLDAEGHVYLDFTGGGLYGQSQVTEHRRILERGIFGNPHSGSPASEATTTLVERARSHVLDYFHASPTEYEAIFTLNASAALKLVGESYPFRTGGRFLLTYDNHNSVNGIREYARQKGAGFVYVPITDPNLGIDEPALRGALESPGVGPDKLFAYPAQSNFSGVQHSLDWIDEAHRHGWDVLLDAAAFAPTNRLNLSRVHPDFVSLSFYKIFGYPTGVGCLLARTEALAKLQRPWFAGGTVLIASAQAATSRSHGFALCPGVSAFEDGTLNYLSIPAVEIGLRFIEGVGIERIHDHVARLTERLLGRLTELHHDSGEPVAHVFGPATTQGRGATVAFNFFDPNGHLISPKKIEREAGQAGISLRTGCHCNPGAGETALHIGKRRMQELFRSQERLRQDRFFEVANHMKEGAVRVSLGIASNEADVNAFVEFASRFTNSTGGCKV
ncbi:MAG TPA: aminotransferase class V-fold PLP-dependent enzyme [Chloroflexota bacterium]|nr:aminotransferase class V-fold PLP-dependent enzyme [Chloroflexota bacterium]